MQLNYQKSYCLIDHIFFFGYTLLHFGTTFEAKKWGVLVLLSVGALC